MTRSSRITIALLVSLLAVAAVMTYGAARIRYWDRMGITGVLYMPDPPASSTRRAKKADPPNPFGLKSGSVMMTSPLGPGSRAGLRTEDTVIAINGIPRENVLAVRALDERLRTGDVVTYSIRRGTEERDVVVPLESPTRTWWYIATLIISTIVAGAFIAIALIVLTRNPDDRRAGVFYAAVMVGAISILGGPAFSLDGSNLRGIMPQQPNLGMLAVYFAIFFALMPLMLHLSLVFPKDRPVLTRSPHVLRWIYGIAGGGAIASLLSLWMSVEAQKRGADFVEKLELPLNIGSAIVAVAGAVAALVIARRTRGQKFRRALYERPLLSIFIYYGISIGLIRIFGALEWKIPTLIALAMTIAVPCIVVALAYPILACVALYRSYRDAGAEERRQVQWPLWAIIIAVVTKLSVVLGTQAMVFIAMAVDHDIDAWVKWLMPLQFVPTIVYLLIPVSFAFAILKYRLMNIDVIIRKTVAYALLSGAIVVLYLALVGGLGTVLVSVAGVKNQTMVIASTLVVALLVVPLRNKLQDFVDRLLFRHRYDYPEALKAIGAETLSATNMNTFLAGAAEKTQQALQSRAVVIFAARHGEFVAAAKVGVADSLLGALRVPQTSMLPLLDRPFDPRKHSLPEDVAAALKKIEAVLVVPVNAPGTAANGFIAVAPKLSSGGYEIEDIDFLRGVADQLDIGMDRIRLQAEEVDFEQARAIQQTLLPRELPSIEGLDVSGVWQPARTMGGDYFDVLALDNRELAVCIGDVAGKGMPAALLMSGLQAAVRASASNSPRDLCERVRRVVVSSLSGGRFVTFFYATLDVDAMKLRWCNAGHNAPVLARADGSIVRLSDGGPAFSRLFRDDRYTESELDLQPGDRLVAFTDGVSEARAEHGEHLGEARIEEIARAHRHKSAREIQQTIVETATAYTGGQLEDDLTLVVVAVM